MRRHLIFSLLLSSLLAAGPVAVLAQQPPVLAIGGAEELARLNLQILRAPTDPALNLRYAALAESLGLNRLALAAYERILMADPANLAAQLGIDRVRAAIQPSTTQYTVEGGYLWESNPRYTSIPSTHGRNQFVGGLNITDERTVDGTRWRSTVDGVLHEYAGTGVSDLDYGRLGGVTGPVLWVNPALAVNPGLGVAGAYFDHRWFYAEVSANATFTTYPGGAEQALTLRAAYRDYNHTFFPGTQGGYADAIGKLTFPDVFPDTAIGLSPWVRLSEIAGGVGKGVFLPFIATDLQPGDYLDLGGKAQILHSLYDEALVLGASFSVGGRFYQSVEVPGSTERRKDVTLSPGVQLIFPHFLAYQNDLRLGYQYSWNHSNVPINSYRDHVINVTVVARF
ncbi:MAG TPA: hypothetical protein VHU15_08855 [Stellaceae bacterium]|nr:hypothetical protein [Stellaceae bacterium]